MFLSQLRTMMLCGILAAVYGAVLPAEPESFLSNDPLWTEPTANVASSASDEESSPQCGDDSSSEALEMKEQDGSSALHKVVSDALVAHHSPASASPWWRRPGSCDVSDDDMTAIYAEFVRANPEVSNFVRFEKIPEEIFQGLRADTKQNKQALDAYTKWQGRKFVEHFGAKAGQEVAVSDDHLRDGPAPSPSDGAAFQFDTVPDIIQFADINTEDTFAVTRNVSQQWHKDSQKFQALTVLRHEGICERLTGTWIGMSSLREKQPPKNRCLPVLYDRSLKKYRPAREEKEQPLWTAFAERKAGPNWTKAHPPMLLRADKERWWRAAWSEEVPPTTNMPDWVRQQTNSEWFLCNDVRSEFWDLLGLDLASEEEASLEEWRALKPVQVAKNEEARKKHWRETIAVLYPNFEKVGKILAQAFATQRLTLDSDLLARWQDFPSGKTMFPSKPGWALLFNNSVMVHAGPQHVAMDKETRTPIEELEYSYWNGSRGGEKTSWLTCRETGWYDFSGNFTPHKPYIDHKTGWLTFPCRETGWYDFSGNFTARKPYVERNGSVGGREPKPVWSRILLYEGQGPNLDPSID